MTRYVNWALLGFAFLLFFACDSSSGGSDAAYPRLYIQSVEVNGVGFVKREITLYDAGLVLATGPLGIAVDVDATVNADHGAVFYIGVTGDPASMAVESYAIRVVALGKSDPAPALPPATMDPVDPYDEPNDLLPPWGTGDSYDLPLDTIVVRELDTADTDIDWFKIVLP